MMSEKQEIRYCKNCGCELVSTNKKKICENCHYKNVQAIRKTLGIAGTVALCAVGFFVNGGKGGSKK